MANPKPTVKKKVEPTQQQKEIDRLRDIGRDKRTEEQSARLTQLIGLERRDRFNRLQVKRVKNARKALRNVTRLGNTASYDYTSDEAGAIIEALTADLAELKRAFTGAPKEKGLYDL